MAEFVEEMTTGQQTAMEPYMFELGSDPEQQERLQKKVSSQEGT